ncbi:MAG: LysR family transcriptional regulator [Methylobacterium frigidaeris]
MPEAGVMAGAVIGSGRFKLRHFQLLAAIEATGGLGLAARSLRITQPAASRLLAEIEAQVGAPVFERLPRGLRANALGEVLTRRARVVAQEVAAAGDELALLRAGRGGTVALGAVTAPAVDVVATTLTGLQASHPELRVTVEVGTSVPLVRMLQENRLDFVLARIPPGSDAGELLYREVRDEELVFLVRDDHPLLAGGAPGLDALVGQTWVMQPPGTLLRTRVDRLFRQAGLPPPGRVLNTSSVVLTLSVVAAGHAIGPVTAAVADLVTQAGRFRRLALDGGVGRVSVEPFGLVRHRHRPLSPAAQSVYAALEAALGLSEPA